MTGGWSIIAIPTLQFFNTLNNVNVNTIKCALSQALHCSSSRSRLWIHHATRFFLPFAEPERSSAEAGKRNSCSRGLATAAQLLC